MPRTPDGKLHMSMHVSAERPGRASLVWKPTGHVLWRAQIEGAPVDLASRNLGIFVKLAANAGYNWRNNDNAARWVAQQLGG